jgi:hypothetical protein
MTIRKRLGLPNKCGWAVPGWSECGDDNDFTGTFQQRRPRIGNGKLGPVIFGRQKNFVMKPTWPIQPASALRDAQQDKFKTALSMWQALTNEQKMFYNQIATRRSKRGYDLFMSQTLKSL